MKNGREEVGGQKKREKFSLFLLMLKKKDCFALHISVMCEASLYGFHSGSRVSICTTFCQSSYTLFSGVYSWMLFPWYFVFVGDSLNIVSSIIFTIFE